MSNKQEEKTWDEYNKFYSYLEKNSELKEAFEGQPISPRPTYKEVCQMILRHASMQIEYVGEHMGMLQMRKQVAWYTAGYPGSSKLRQEVNQITTYEELKSLLTRFAVSDIIV